MNIEAGFWQAYQRFLKTPLITEQANPATSHLSDLAKTDLPAAYALLKQLDLQAIESVLQQEAAIAGFRDKCQQVSGRVILVGCGASGRIAMQMEYWARSQNDLTVEAVLAGGDITLIEALESCEDSPEFARKQMELLNLTHNDWVIGLSASGESPFILAALRLAESRTRLKPVLICCNPTAALLARDPEHLAGDDRFEVLPLVVGEMALTGSTRMQATTAMTLFLILTLLPEQFKAREWRACYQALAMQAFCGLTDWEAQRFQAQERVTYHAKSDLALAILADMTERAPTFNIPRILEKTAPIALILDDADDALDAWTKLLGRGPQALNFTDLEKTKWSYLLGFDLSTQAGDSRWKIDLAKAFPEYFDLKRRPGVTPIARDFLLRLILVNHSTLVMGRCGFYAGNVMIYLKPANFKLMDRAIRYVQFLYQQQRGKQLDYKRAAKVLFEIMPHLKPAESIVLKVLQAML